MMTEGIFVLSLMGGILSLMLIGAWWNRNKPPGMGM